MIQGWTQSVNNGTAYGMPAQFGLCITENCSASQLWTFGMLNAIPLLSAGLFGTILADPLQENVLGKLFMYEWEGRQRLTVYLHLCQVGVVVLCYRVVLQSLRRSARPFPIMLLNSPFAGPLTALPWALRPQSVSQVSFLPPWSTIDEFQSQYTLQR